MREGREELAHLILQVCMSNGKSTERCPYFRDDGVCYRVNVDRRLSIKHEKDLFDWIAKRFGHFARFGFELGTS